MIRQLCAAIRTHTNTGIVPEESRELALHICDDARLWMARALPEKSLRIRHLGLLRTSFAHPSRKIRPMHPASTPGLTTGNNFMAQPGRVAASARVMRLVSL